MGVVRVGVAAGMTALVAGCAVDGRPVPAGPTLTPYATGAISQATWHDGPWPFTVPEGTLQCYLEDSMVTFVVDGVEYGLNDTARAFGGYPDVYGLVADGPMGYVEINAERQPVPTHADMRGVFDAARGLCS
jgi:hypothetical protein